MAHGSNTAQLTMLDQLVPKRSAPVTAEQDRSRPSPHIEPSAENFRVCCQETLAMLRACEGNPWNPVDARYYRVLFRLRSEWLPQEEGAALRAEFAEQWLRLGIEETPPAQPAADGR